MEYNQVAIVYDENEEQYSEMLKEELRQKGYRIPEDWGKPPKSAK